MQVKLVVIAILSTLLLFGSYYYGKSQAKVEYVTKTIEVQSESSKDIKKTYEAVKNERDIIEKATIDDKCNFVLNFDIRACGLQ